MSSTRSSPRISINQLASYFVARPAQRRRIVQNARRPAAFVVNWYDPARRCLHDFLVGGAQDESVLTAGIDRLYATQPANRYEQSRLRTNAGALEAVLESYEQLHLEGMQVTAGPPKAPRLPIGGIEVSVRPEFLIRGEHRGEPAVGALKLYFSKDVPLNDVSAPSVACLLMRHVEEHHATPDAAVRPALCRVYDIFARRVYPVPAAVTRRLRDVEAACQEIGLLWPTIAA